MKHPRFTAVGVALLAVSLVFICLDGWADPRPVVHSRFVVPSSTQLASTSPSTKPYETAPQAAPLTSDIQSLVWMEEALLGSSQSTLPVPERLKILEETFFGVAYPFEPTSQRLARLDKALNDRKEDALRKRQADETEKKAALAPTVTEEWDETLPMVSNRLTNPASLPPATAPTLPRSNDPAALAYGGMAPSIPPTVWNPPQPENSTPSSQGWESTPSPEVMNESLLSLEKSVLKATYPSEMPAARLDRLETAVFHRSAANEGLSENERLQRLIAVASAQADSNYNRNNNSTPATIKSLWPLIPFVILMFL